MMSRSYADLILLHTPTFIDDPTKEIGPIADLIPSSSQFELYPIGFLTLSNYLEKFGFSVRIINLAILLKRAKNLNLYDFFSSIPKPILFGIDLHWLPHCYSVIKLAKIIKKVHKDTPIVIGGLAASHYYEEILEYPFIDFVIRGDSAEEPLHLLISKLKENKLNFEDIPNLSYKKKENIISNPISYVPKSLDYLSFSYSKFIRNVIKYRSLFAYLPTYDWLRYPITCLIVAKGCIYNCTNCGGSNFAYSKVCNRRSPAFRNPKLIVQDIFSISELFSSPIFIVGDIFMAGEDYAKEFLNSLKYKLEQKRLDNELVLELFSPPPYFFWERIEELTSKYKLKFNLQVSFETHDTKIRKIAGRNYSSYSMESHLQEAKKYARRIDAFFFIGLPHQNYNDINNSVDYMIYLMNRFYPKLHAYISPQAPFLDPSSIAFQFHKDYKFNIYANSLKEHIISIISCKNWVDMLNYDTEELPKFKIAEATYESNLRLIDAKSTLGLINKRIAKYTKIALLQEYSDIKEKKEITKRINILAPAKELEWSTPKISKFKIKNLIKIINKKDG